MHVETNKVVISSCCTKFPVESLSVSFQVISTSFTTFLGPRLISKSSRAVRMVLYCKYSLQFHFDCVYTFSNKVFCRSWDVERMKKAPVKMFTHPSYVYCAKYHPVATHIIVSGCYDNIIRVWSSLSSGKEGTVCAVIMISQL